MKIIILISGRAGVGKTTVANMLLKNIDQKAVIHPLAFKLKNIARDCFSWNGKKDALGRNLLIGLARVARDYDLDFWVRSLVNDLPVDASVIIIDDWRYLNEYEYLLKNQVADLVYTIRVERPENELLKSSSSYNDPSETSLPSAETNPNYYDILLYNSGTLDDLDCTVKRLLNMGLMDIINGKSTG